MLSKVTFFVQSIRDIVNSGPFGTPTLCALGLRIATDLSTSVIAVHGLNGHAYATWVHYQNSSSQEGPGPMWLRDFLPKTIPKARISTYGYNSALIGPNTSVSTLKDFAKDLLQRIIDDRKTEAVRESFNAQSQ